MMLHRGPAAGKVSRRRGKKPALVGIAGEDGGGGSVRLDMDDVNGEVVQLRWGESAMMRPLLRAIEGTVEMIEYSGPGGVPLVTPVTPVMPVTPVTPVTPVAPVAHNANNTHATSVPSVTHTGHAPCVAHACNVPSNVPHSADTSRRCRHACWHGATYVTCRYTRHAGAVIPAGVEPH